MIMNRSFLTILCICLTIGIGSGIVCRYFSPKLFLNLKLRAHQEESVANGMRALYQCIDDAALMNPRSFADSVGPGIRTNVLGLPPVLLTNFVYSTKDVAHLLLDRWQRPYIVSITPLPGPKTNVLWFDVRIWSRGASGLDEGMEGDYIGGEIYSGQRHLKLDIP